MAAVEKTYGDALFSLILEEDESALSDILQQLKSISAVFAEQPDFIKLLKTPTIPMDEKVSVVKEIFEGKVHRLVLNFLLVLAENGRADCFDKILAYFVQLHNDYKNIADVTVTSAMPLSDEAAEKIRAKMASVTGKTVNITLKTDPSIIGGAVISYGNTTIDGSVKARLEQLKNDIAGIIA